MQVLLQTDTAWRVQHAFVLATGIAIAQSTGTVVTTVLLFSKLNKMFFGYFDPVNILLDNKNK